ncbi:MAG TPA: cytochrome P450 [Gemmataceae bacterium]|jgi:cytochrome P450|nr:cytochrome P450 [Gemmataceae bacterium]
MGLEHLESSAPTNPPAMAGLRNFPADPVAWMRRLYRTHGTLSALEEDGQRVIFAFGPTYNQQILSNTESFHARFFAIRGPRNSAQRRLTHALLTMNGAEHKLHRRIVMGPFQKASVDGYRDALAALAEQSIAAWKPGEIRDIFDDMTHYMLRVASSVLFGFDLPEMAYEIGRLTARWVTMNHELGVGAFVSDEQIASSYYSLLELAEELERQIVGMIEQRRSSNAGGNDVLSLLIRARDQDGNSLSHDELIGQAAILFGAAHLTTANTLTWTLFLLAQHPLAAEELVQELNQILRDQPPTIGQLDQLKMLDRVVKESMRVLPASSYSQRVTAKTVNLGPYRLQRNTPVIFSQFITHHMPELFPEPERFLPERWLSIRPSPYAYMPFAAGPRMCLGGPLAILVIKITLATILQRYRLTVVPGATINGKVTATMLTPTSAVPMIVHEPTTPFRAEPVTGNIHEMVILDSAPVTQRSIPPLSHVPDGPVEFQPLAANPATMSPCGSALSSTALDASGYEPP